MLKHASVWRAIDELAELHGFSPSGLAREAGLDATTFNASKRITPEGKERWPSTESLAKILAVTGASMMEFAALAEKTSFKNRIPVLSHADGGRSDNFDANGTPTGKAWKLTAIPGTSDPQAFGILLPTKVLEPTYRVGALLVASPAARIEKGNHVAVVTADGVVSVRRITRVVGRKYELTGLARGTKLVASANQLRLIAKITMIVE